MSHLELLMLYASETRSPRSDRSGTTASQQRSERQPQATTIQFFLIHPSSPSLIALIISSRSSYRRPFSHHSHAFYTPLTDSLPSIRTLENDDQLSPRRRDLSIPFTFSFFGTVFIVTDTSLFFLTFSICLAQQ
jgi:hypothetical protein